MIKQQVCSGAFRDAECQVWPLFWANSVKKVMGTSLSPITAGLELEI